MTNQIKRDMIFIGLLLGAYALGGAFSYFRNRPDKDNVPEVVRRYGSHIPDAPPGRYVGHMIDVIDPTNGIMIQMIFTADQWKMLHQLALAENKDVDTLISELAVERYQNGFEGRD